MPIYNRQSQRRTNYADDFMNIIRTFAQMQQQQEQMELSKERIELSKEAGIRADKQLEMSEASQKRAIEYQENQLKSQKYNKDFNFIKSYRQAIDETTSNEDIDAAIKIINKHNFADNDGKLLGDILINEFNIIKNSRNEINEINENAFKTMGDLNTMYARGLNEATLNDIVAVTSKGQTDAARFKMTSAIENWDAVGEKFVNLKEFSRIADMFDADRKTPLIQAKEDATPEEKVMIEALNKFGKTGNYEQGVNFALNSIATSASTASRALDTPSSTTPMVTKGMQDEIKNKTGTINDMYGLVGFENYIPLEVGASDISFQNLHTSTVSNLLNFMAKEDAGFLAEWGKDFGKLKKEFEKNPNYLNAYAITNYLRENRNIAFSGLEGGDKKEKALIERSLELMFLTQLQANNKIPDTDKVIPNDEKEKNIKKVTKKIKVEKKKKENKSSYNFGIPEEQMKSSKDEIQNLKESIKYLTEHYKKVTNESIIRNKPSTKKQIQNEYEDILKFF